MSIHSKKEFAELCNMKTNELSVYIKRLKVIEGPNETIDDNVDKNRAFLEKRRKKQTLSEPKQLRVIEFKEKTTSEPEETSTGQSYTESERQLKYLDTIKRQKEIEKLDIEIAKKRGEVVPSELIKPVFLQHNQSILTEFKNGIDEILRVFAKKSSLSVNQIAELKGEMVDIINRSVNKAIVTSENSVEVIISEHAEKRGVGQKI
jgi:hypothetical protein